MKDHLEYTKMFDLCGKYSRSNGWHFECKRKNQTSNELGFLFEKPIFFEKLDDVHNYIIKETSIDSKNLSLNLFINYKSHGITIRKYRDESFYAMICHFNKLQEKILNKLQIIKNGQIDVSSYVSSVNDCSNFEEAYKRVIHCLETSPQPSFIKHILQENRFWAFVSWIVGLLMFLALMISFIRLDIDETFLTNFTPFLSLFIGACCGMALYDIKTNQSKELTKIYRVFFKTQKTKALLGVLEEARYEFKQKKIRTFEGIYQRIKKMVLTQKEPTNEDMSPRSAIYNIIASLTYEHINSGQNHMYRGVINPMGSGKDYIVIYNFAIDELMRLGELSKEEANKCKSVLKNNIQAVG